MSQDPFPPNPYSSPFEQTASDRVTRAAEKHSGLGIASFIIGLVGIAGGCGVMIGIMMLAFAVVGPMGPNPPDAEAIALGIGLLADIGFCVVGLIMGIVGAFQRERKKIFAILGILFNALVLLGFCSLFTLGVVVG